MSEQTMTDDPRIAAVPDIHGHAKGEHKLFVDERPIPYTARMLFLWFFHACRRGAPRFLMVADHINYLTFEDPAAVNLVRRALKLAQAGDLYGAAETAGVDVQHAAVVGEGLRRGMRYSIGAEVDNDPRSRPDAQNIVDAMRPDGIVRSIHFLQIKHPQHGENWMWPFDNPEFRDVYDLVGTEQTWELYMASLLDAIEKLPGHIVGHFYVPAKFGHWPSDDVLEAYEDRLLDACLERGMAVEVNSRYYYKHAIDDEAQLEKYSAANARLMRKAKEKGVLVAVGSDAHSPKDQGRGFVDVLALLDRAEINEIAFPIDGRLARVALRATEELRQASSKAVREQRPLAAAIPGMEEPESGEDDDKGSDASDVPVETVDRPAAATPATPKKRPSRAKKPAAASASNGAGQLPEAAALSAADETATHAPEDATVEPVAKASAATVVVEAIAAVAKRVTQKLAETLQAREPSQAAEEPAAETLEPAVADPARAGDAVTSASLAEPERATTPPIESEPPEATSIEATPAEAELAETTPSEAAPVEVVAATHETPAAAPEAPEPESSVLKRLARRIRPSRTAPAPNPKRSPAPVTKTARRPAVAAKKAAPTKTTSSKSTSGKAGASKAAASKAAPAAKKRVVKKAAPAAAKKVTRPSRPAAKKVTAKKATPARKAAKASTKTASRSGAKKASQKKTTVKKKAAKRR